MGVGNVLAQEHTHTHTQTHTDRQTDRHTHTHTQVTHTERIKHNIIIPLLYHHYHDITTTTPGEACTAITTQ